MYIQLFNRSDDPRSSLMSRHYSIRSFFRQMPMPLLGRYVAQKGLLAGVDFSGPRRRNPQALILAWDALRDEERAAVEAEFQEIFAMSCDNGFRAILEEAKWHIEQTEYCLEDAAANQRAQESDLEAFTEKLLRLPGHFERAMITFLEHQAYWDGAMQFQRADSLRYWRKSKDLPKVAPAVDSESLRRLEAEVSAYFKSTESRGRHCTADVLRRGDFEYFFVYLEDYSRKDPEWLAGELTPRRHTPASEIVFVYHPREGTLDINARGSSKAIGPLQEIFTKVILNDGNARPMRAGAVYDLNPLRRRDFSFVIPPASRIEDVRLRMLKLSSSLQPGDRITLEADTRCNPFAVHDLLARLEGQQPLVYYAVTQVELAATVRTARGYKTVTVRITHPSSCSLKHEDIDQELRAMLQASGIEPQSPRATARPALTPAVADAETQPASAAT